MTDPIRLRDAVAAFLPAPSAGSRPGTARLPVTRPAIIPPCAGGQLIAIAFRGSGPGPRASCSGEESRILRSARGPAGSPGRVRGIS